MNIIVKNVSLAVIARKAHLACFDRKEFMFPGMNHVDIIILPHVLSCIAMEKASEVILVPYIKLHRAFGSAFASHVGFWIVSLLHRVNLWM